MNIAKLDSAGLEKKALELRRLALKIIFQANATHPTSNRVGLIFKNNFFAEKN